MIYANVSRYAFVRRITCSSASRSFRASPVSSEWFPPGVKYSGTCWAAQACPSACSSSTQLSAVPWNVYPEAYPYPTGKKYIAMAKAIVGHKKLLWGSDLPCPLTRDSFEHLADYFQQGEPVFTEAELEDVDCNNALDAFPFER